MSVQKLRLQHGWSQKQLAQASGLSTRTVQRIEAGEPASTETLKSLAAVFEVDFSSLNPESTMNEATSSPTQQQEQEAFEHVRTLRAFYLHLMRYVIVILGLLAINLIFSPHRLWVLWVAAGWGIGLLMRAGKIFMPTLLLGADWEKRAVEKRLGRPL